MKSRFAIAFIVLFLQSALSFAQQLHFTVTMKDPASHVFHVELACTGMPNKKNIFKLPTWTPGYYQYLNYERNVENFKAYGKSGKQIVTMPLQDTSVWHVLNEADNDFTVTYDVKTSRNFVATPWLDSSHGYIVGAGVFIYPERQLQMPVLVTIKPDKKWKQIATGLEPVAGKVPFTYKAPNYDILYDCPILIGQLDSLPVFRVKGIPHRFIGRDMGVADAASFTGDLQKIVTAASDIIGDIPYKEYTFISIGAGMGGIEHLNNTTISFSGEGLDKRPNRLRTLNFLAHEYFHHYNVKRIRPLELGPFDYDKGSPTNLLWVSEGLTVYYEYIVLRKAGITTPDEVLQSLSRNITAIESKTGRLYQSLQQASYNTWADGPFGRSNDPINKTISYYDKGPAVGMLFDLAIRYHSQNKKSLDDVMRTLYQTFYQQKQRGFTEAELQQVIEQTAGTPLPELFEYIYTTKVPDYNKYLAYAGLQLDPAPTATTHETVKKFTISRIANPTAQQQALLDSWLGK